MLRFYSKTVNLKYLSNNFPEWRTTSGPDGVLNRGRQLVRFHDANPEVKVG
jgi:hypothetical protein